jgi:hypothetical protein
MAIGQKGTGYWSDTGWVEGTPPADYIKSANTTYQNLGFNLPTTTPPSSVDKITTGINNPQLPNTPSTVVPIKLHKKKHCNLD